MEQELNLWQDLEQEKARYTLKLKSLCQKPILNKSVIKHYETIIKRINKDIENLQKRLPSLEDKEFKENKDLLTSINGIGKKTALLLLASTNNFKISNIQKHFANILELSLKCIIPGIRKYQLVNVEPVKVL